MARYEIRRDPVWKLPLLLIGATRERSYVELTNDGLELRFGVSHASIPWQNVREVRHTSWPWTYGIGVRLAPDDTVGLVGSTKGVVRIGLYTPAEVSLFITLHPKNVTVSLVDPDTFLRDAESRLRRAA